MITANAAPNFAVFMGGLLPAHKGQDGGCKVCAHPERVGIELLLAGGAGQKAVGQKYGISKDSVHRHWHGHVSEERRARLLVGPVQKQALAARVAEENSSVIDNLRIIRAGLFESFDTALRAGDRNGVAQLTGRLQENLRIAGNITGELAQSPLVQLTQNNLFIGDPAFARFQADLVRVLTKHPEALADVVHEFERISTPSVPLPALEHEP
jgi:hypothetical protein